MSKTTESLRESVTGLYTKWLKNHPDAKHENNPTPAEWYVYNFMDDLLNSGVLEAELASAEKAYGGCHNCYGKGYATTITYAGTARKKWKLDEISYCSCERGQSLKGMVVAKEASARLQTAKEIQEIAQESSHKPYLQMFNIKNYVDVLGRQTPEQGTQGKEER